MSAEPTYEDDVKIHRELLRRAAEYNTLLRAAREEVGLIVTTEVVHDGQIKVTTRREILS